MSDALPLHKIQANVLRGFRYGEAHSHSHYAFLSFEAPQGTKVWLRRVQEKVTSCAAWDKGAPYAFGLSFSAEGLKLLGVSAATMAAMDPAFAEGMLARAKALGDVGPSAPDKWNAPFTAGRIHAAISVSSNNPTEVEKGLAWFTSTLAETGVTVVHSETANAFPDKPKGTEHFGYVDGIGQPYVEGSGIPDYPGEGTPTKDGWAPLKRGEFVLGYENEVGQTPGNDPLLRDGSYLVFRKLHEWVTSFREYLGKTAADQGLDEELLAAKFVGRWRSGAPLELSPDRDDPALGSDLKRNNNFRYDDDKKGTRCPFGAHIRRANPRNDPTGPGTVQVRQHRIIRRALPYGPWLPEGSADDGKPRGVLFVVVNASIVQQFEYVQRSWMNGLISSSVLSTDADKDPIIGAQDGEGKLLIPSEGDPKFAWNLPRFVDCRGGAYLFAPSLPAILELSK